MPAYMEASASPTREEFERAIDWLQGALESWFGLDDPDREHCASIVRVLWVKAGVQQLRPRAPVDEPPGARRES